MRADETERETATGVGGPREMRADETEREAATGVGGPREMRADEGEREAATGVGGPREMRADEVELPAGVEGEICVKSPGVMRGYYNDPEATAMVLMPGGWLRTGDLGFVDEEGFLYVTGRLKDVIILGGVNVLPADVEETVDGVPGVRYSAAVGLDSERAGTQRLHVVAEVRNDGASHDEYHGLVREIVSRVHKTQGHRPARVLLVRASTIPKTSSGKIQRSRLAQMIEGGQLHDRVVYGDH
jgi:acyl-CoA synthetase (AMP-forming)/AMP-acid ligase II